MHSGIGTRSCGSHHGTRQSPVWPSVAACVAQGLSTPVRSRGCLGKLNHSIQACSSDKHVPISKVEIPKQLVVADWLVLDTIEASSTTTRITALPGTVLHGSSKRGTRLSLCGFHCILEKVASHSIRPKVVRVLEFDWSRAMNWLKQTSPPNRSSLPQFCCGKFVLVFLHRLS